MVTPASLYILRSSLNLSIDTPVRHALPFGAPVRRLLFGRRLPRAASAAATAAAAARRRPAPGPPARAVPRPVSALDAFGRGPRRRRHRLQAPPRPPVPAAAPTATAARPAAGGMPAQLSTGPPIDRPR